jgi:hypothetical protein
MSAVDACAADDRGLVFLMRGWTALGASSRSWRSLDEEVRTASYSSFFLLTAYESPEQRAESGSRALPRRGGSGEGLGRSRGTCALVAVAGRGGEELFPHLCHTVEGLFTSRAESICSTAEQLRWLRRAPHGHCDGGPWRHFGAA